MKNKKEKYNVLEFRPRKNSFKNRKQQQKFLEEVMVLFQKYKDYPMLAIQNYEIKSKTKKEPILFLLPDGENSYFYLYGNCFINENQKGRQKQLKSYEKNNC